MSWTTDILYLIYNFFYIAIKSRLGNIKSNRQCEMNYRNRLCNFNNVLISTNVIIYSNPASYGYRILEKTPYWDPINKTTLTIFIIIWFLFNL